MDILFLGTSAGAPTRQRNVTALALLPDQGSDWYLIDCGEATQHQLLNTSLSVHGLRAIFITHVHGDHCYGLPGLLASAAMNGRKTPLHIIAPAGIKAWLHATHQMSESFLPFELQFTAVESLVENAGSWQDQDMQVQAIKLSHRVPSYAYRFTETRTEAVLDTVALQATGIPAGPLWGKLKRGEDVQYEGQTITAADYLQHPHPLRSIVVGGDNDRPDLLRDACTHAQVLVHEATYTADVAVKVGELVQHSAAATVANFAAAIGLPNLVLTHFSARYQADPNKSPCISDIQAEAARYYQGNLILAEDFARFRLAKNGVLSRIA